MSDSRPAKRPRNEDASITRSEIWYKDGSAVLQAQDTQFRVHWSVLAKHSVFFKDLESLPQPNPADLPTVDGCPVVEIQDAVEDVEHLLTALYDPSFLTQTALPLATVGALIRLGRKYDFKVLLDPTVARITYENPTTYDSCDALLVDGVYRPTRIMVSGGFFFDLLMLARENNILSALPVAYYRAVKCGPARLLDGMKREDGTVASLPLVHLRRCIIGRDRLLSKQFQPGYPLGWLRQWQLSDCKNPLGCDRRRSAMLSHYLDGNVVGALDRFEAPDVRKAFCATCCQHILDSNATGLKKMWEELPGIFDLVPWDQLKNDL